ncbi:MAG: hypothetical protein INR71_05210 [Terriglobus roseus]|nr:hypothetical protein [Terriglobus roseus]
MSKERPADLMDVDSNGLSHLSPAVGDGAVSDLPSPVVDESPVLPQSTADIGDEKHTQSERVQQIAPDVATFDVRPSVSPGGPGTASIEHAAFAPSETSANALLLAGSNLARIYVVPSSSTADANFSQNSINIDFQAPNLLSIHVLAFAWTPDCGTAVMALWETYTNEQGEKMSLGNLVRLSPGSGSELFTKESLDKTIRDVVALKWNKASRSLLCLSITDKTSWLRVWQASSEKGQPLNALPPKKVPHQRYFDAEWIGDSRFVVCGEDATSTYEITPSSEVTAVEIVPTPGVQWHLVRFDPLTQLAALVSKDTPDIAIYQAASASDAPTSAATDATSPASVAHPRLSTHRLAANATDLAFHPVPNRASLAPTDARLLAAAHENGQVVVFDARAPWRVVAQLALGMGRAAEACAWSPDGFLLAAAGAGRVVVWGKEDIAEREKGAGAVGEAPLPRAVWVAQGAAWGAAGAGPGMANGHGTRAGLGLRGASSERTGAANGDLLTNGVENGMAAMEIDGDTTAGRHADTASEASEDVDLRHQKLVWDADGKTLIYTMGDQVRRSFLAHRDVVANGVAGCRDQLQVMRTRPSRQRDATTTL